MNTLNNPSADIQLLQKISENPGVSKIASYFNNTAEMEAFLEKYEMNHDYSCISERQRIDKFNDEIKKLAEIKRDLIEFRNSTLESDIHTPFIIKYSDTPAITEKQVESLQFAKAITLETYGIIDAFLQTQYAKGNNINKDLETLSPENVKPLHILIAKCEERNVREQYNNIIDTINEMSSSYNDPSLYKDPTNEFEREEVEKEQKQKQADLEKIAAECFEKGQFLKEFLKTHSKYDKIELGLLAIGDNTIRIAINGEYSLREKINENDLSAYNTGSMSLNELADKYFPNAQDNNREMSSTFKR